MDPSDIGNNAERCDDCDCDEPAGDIAPSIVPTVNLGGQVIIVGGSPASPAPAPAPAPVAPVKVVPPKQLEEYLNKWNKPETRSAEEEFSFPWLRAKITSIIKDFLS